MRRDTAKWALALGISTVAAWPSAGWAQQMRCQNRLVGVGDTALQLKALCGAPDHVAVRTVAKAEGVFSPPVVAAPQATGPLATNQAVVVAPNAVTQDVVYTQEQVETWTYAGASGDLTRLVTVKRGKVAAIQTVRKVVADSDPGCSRGAPRNGATSGEVPVRCGAPADVSTWTEERVRRRADGYEVRLRVEMARWVYDLGPGRLLRILTFENGRLIKVETGPRSPG